MLHQDQQSKKGSTDGIDYAILDCLGFLKESVENRPTTSSMANPLVEPNFHAAIHSDLILHSQINQERLNFAASFHDRTGEDLRELVPSNHGVLQKKQKLQQAASEMIMDSQKKLDSVLSTFLNKTNASTDVDKIYLEMIKKLLSDLTLDRQTDLYLDIEELLKKYL